MYVYVNVHIYIYYIYTYVIYVYIYTYVIYVYIYIYIHNIYIYMLVQGRIYRKPGGFCHQIQWVPVDLPLNRSQRTDLMGLMRILIHYIVGLNH